MCSCSEIVTSLSANTVQKLEEDKGTYNTICEERSAQCKRRNGRGEEWERRGGGGREFTVMYMYSRGHVMKNVLSLTTIGLFTYRFM